MRNAIFYLIVVRNAFNSNEVEKKSFESYSKVWDIEPEGATKKELEIYQNFENELEIKEGRYSFKLTFKSTSKFVPESYVTSKKTFAVVEMQIR